MARRPPKPSGRTRSASSRRASTKGPEATTSPRAKPAPKRRPKGASPAPARAAPDVVKVELEESNLESALSRLRDELSHLVKKGRHTKVRFKLRGKPLLPDLPLAAVVAAEAATFWWAGLLRVLLVNVGAHALLSVEVVSEAEEEVGRGREALLGGDLAQALACFNKALAMDRGCAAAHLNLGIAAKLRGRLDEARGHLERAEKFDPDGASGQEARRLLDQFHSPKGAPSAS